MSSINGLGSSNAWASTGSQRAARPPGGPDPAGFKNKLFNTVDADSSGGVDATELQSLLDKLSAKTGSSVGGGDTAATFNTMDSNGDGSLAKNELDAGLQSLLAPPADTLAFAQSRGSAAAQDSTRDSTRDAERFSQADSDGSGGIDATELKAAMEASPRSAGKPVDQGKVDALFSKLDSDGSGDISAAEMAAGKPGRGGGTGGMSGAGASASGQAGPPPGAGGPPPGGGPGGARGAGGNDGDSDDGSGSSSNAAIDPLDSNGDGTVSASERAAGQTQAVLKQLLAAADSNGDQQISRGEAKRFGELLSQVVANAAAGGAAGSRAQPDTTSDRSDRSDRQNRRADNPGFADQVLRHYARASAAADTASSFSVSA